jgi:hypothetical protein
VTAGRAAYGPQPPSWADIHQAQAAVDAAREAGCGIGEYERLVLDRLHTKAAYLAADDRELLRAVEAEDPEPEAEI